MSAFKNGGLYFKNKSDQITPNSGHTIFYANSDGKIHFIVDTGDESVIASQSYVDASISGGSLSAQVATNTSDISNLNGDVAALSGAIDSNASDISAIQGDYVDLSSAQSVGGLKTFTDDVTINADLYVNGTNFIVNTTNVSASDNTITINAGEVGAGVTAGTAGIIVDRGSETNYQFVFNESSDTFRVGEIGSEQAVATREDSPIDGGVAVWDNATSKFNTSTNFVASIEGLDGTVNVSGGKDITISTLGGNLNISSDGLNQTEADALYVSNAGDTMTGDLTFSGAGIILDVATFTPANSGNFLTFDNTGTLTDSGFGVINLGTILNGSVDLNTSDSIYTVTHSFASLTEAFPLASLIIPTSGSAIYVQGITNRTTTSFDVVLSEVPEVVGYTITWAVLSEGTAGIGGGGGGGGGGFTVPDVHLQDQRPNLTDGGTATEYLQPRVLNTVLIDTNSRISLVSNQFTILTETITVWMEAWAMICQGGKSQILLYNVTDDVYVTAFHGMSQYSGTANFENQKLSGRGQVTLEVGKTYEIQTYAANITATFGLGFNTSFADENIYADVIWWEV